MAKERIIEWLDKQISINKDIEENNGKELRRLDVYRYDELHINNALSIGEIAGITTYVDEYVVGDSKYIGYFFYKNVKFFSLYKEV